MNTSSIIVLAIVGSLFALAIWRVAKKGAPCECGDSHKDCCCSRKCCCGEEKLA